MQIVAMTREMGSLGKDVAARIAAKRGRKVVYHEMIGENADKMRVRHSHVVRLLDSGATLWEKLTADKTSVGIFTADETFRIALGGEAAVIRGWGPVHLLTGIPHVIRVRVCAPFELRVERMMQRLGTTDRESVQHEMELAEEAHAAITRRHFRLDWRDSEHYDLVLSTGRLSVDECVDELERVMALPRFQPTLASERQLRALALEWSIRAALRRDPRTAGARVSLECFDGMVHVGGCAASDEQARNVREVILHVPGVRQLECALRNVAASSWMGAEA
jgi:cytidylate kinase